MSSAYSNSPHYSTLGLRFVGASALRKSIIFPQACFPAVFIFQAQALHPVAAESEQKRHAYCTIRKVRAWNLQRWRGRGPAHLIPARCAGHPARSAASVCSQARILWKLWADATWRRAPMPRSARWIVHNTNHWGAVRPNMIPGKIKGSDFDPSCQVGFKWDDDPPATWLRTSGSSKTFSSDRVIALRRNSYGGDGEERNAVVPRADGPQVMPSPLALTLWQVGLQH
jgi:hypothetical protein